MRSPKVQCWGITVGFNSWWVALNVTDASVDIDIPFFFLGDWLARFASNLVCKFA